MKTPIRTSFLGLVLLAHLAGAQRSEWLLESEWKFARGEQTGADAPAFDDLSWQSVTVPHDWAIFGPFDKEIDMQEVRIEQNLEQVATEKTGRTGALPFTGVGWYRTEFDLPELGPDRMALLIFEGAMSEAQVYVNGQSYTGHPYGYSYFHLDITDAVEAGANTLAVRLQNLDRSSRWYPGAGLFRKVRVLVKNRACFEQWGTFVTTPVITPAVARVNVRAAVRGEVTHARTVIRNGDGAVVSEQASMAPIAGEIVQDIAVAKPRLWSPDAPLLYTAEMTLYRGEEVLDRQTIRFGIRSIEFVPEKGFFLNGKVTKFKGVCLHHDLGPLGAAVNRAALRRQLEILEDMGCNAIRSAHNMPSFEQLELCDEMGFLFIAESFDEWARPKVENGYHRFFDQWAEKDVVNLVRATRNHPCIVLWSSGNEVPDQWGSAGVKRAKWLQDLFHREDPTRKVTVGMDQVANTMKTGFGALLDIPGLNYRVHLYEEAHHLFPQGLILGSETASTVSSRGVYKFPVEAARMKTYADGQSSSYDLEYCSWSNLPETDFVMQDDHDWVIGEFVWTGFDYLGEPTPYDEYWPSRSSYFGICDLAGLPKDRYYLYRSRWNTRDDTLHILPHWNWPERIGEKTPVFVYTSYDRAELFLNGVSQGVRAKTREGTLQERYRLMWSDVAYQPGTLRVVAFDDRGKAVAEAVRRTAGPPAALRLEADRTTLRADGEDLSFVTVSIVDVDGNLCPLADHRLGFAVSGPGGRYRAACNGDPTSLEMFHEPTMKAFNGKLVAIVQSSATPGEMVLRVSGEGLPDQALALRSVDGR